ncbi:MAG: SbmA/BacA-like family transporter [Luteolibacter sp.]|nr:SbmA/BacA-like family transporter [Luteolibacter sp.]
MNEPKVSKRLQAFRRLIGAIRNFLKSPVGGKARLLLAALLLLMLGINGMNVANSYVGRYFMSAIESRDTAGFVRFAWLYVAVFAGSTLTGVLFRFTEERLGLLWRDWLTRRITGIYIDRQLYLHFAGEDEVSNPDQRMTEDVKQLTTSTLSFVLMMLNGTLTVLSFSGVLWAISPKLFLIAVLYALGGSALTIWLGRPLIRLNYRQSDFEADFRSELIRTREDGNEIAASGSEQRVRERLTARIDGLVSNLRHIISVNRNLSFFTTGYNYLIQLIPVLIVAPMFIQRQVEFGVIGQSAMAFVTLLGAFSLVITQFQAISSYASVVARLGEFVSHAEKRDRIAPPDESP